MWQARAGDRRDELAEGVFAAPGVTHGRLLGGPGRFSRWRARQRGRGRRIKHPSAPDVSVRMSVPVRSVLRAAYKGVALAAAMPQGFLLDALAALLSGVDSDMNDVEGSGRVQLSVYPSSCLKGLMHDE